MQEKAQDSQGNDLDSGTNSRESFANWNPDSSSWRTSQRSLLEGWTPYSEPWPRSGTMRNGRAYEHPTWAQGIDGSGSLSLRGDWMTPTTRDWKDGACADSNVPTNGLLGRQAVRAWPTATKSDGAGGPGRGKNRAGGDNLRTATQWPTPDATASNDGEDLESWLARRERVKATGINGNGMGTPLAVAVRLPETWSTPTASDSIDDGARWSKTQRTTTSDVLAPTGTRDPSTRGLKLSAAWVEQLMGFPPGWTLLDPASPSTPGKRPASRRTSKTEPRASRPSATPSSRKSPRSSGDG